MAYHASRESVAYDYDAMMSHFSRTPAEVPEPQQPVHNKRQKPQFRAIPGGKAAVNTLFRPKVFLIMMAVLLAAGVVLHSYMQVTVLTSEVADARTELVELRAIQTALLTKQEYTLSDEAIEQYAQEAGMFKLDNSQVEWYEMSNPDKVEVSGSGAGIRGVLDSLIHSFSATLEYLR